MRCICLLDGVVLNDLVGPLAELDGALVLDFEANGDDRLQAVVLNTVEPDGCLPFERLSIS